MNMVRTRIAPSPTGFPHIGTIYQVLFDFAFAKKNGGKFILRIEDTDRTRFVKGAEEVIYDALAWFGLNPDESPKVGGEYGPYRQSERLALYKKYVDELIKKKHAYYCFCTRERLEEMRKKQEAAKIAPMYDKTCLKLSQETIDKNLSEKVPYVVRMKIPENRTIVVSDMISGDISFDSNTIDNQVILKSDGYPTYHLAVVVDDHLMNISHVFRGKEWISSTPKHVLLYEYFGWEIPQHGHLPLILNTDGKGKLSKRHGHSSVSYYREHGYVADAVRNYLSNIVWNHPQGKEIYSLTEFIELLDITKITSQGPRFDVVKLDWINGEYIRQMSDENLFQELQPFVPKDTDESLVRKLIPLSKERMKHLTDFGLYLKPFVNIKPVVLPEKYREYIGPFRDLFTSLSDWNAKTLESISKKLVTEKGWSIRPAFMAIRLAITGEEVGLPLFETLEIMGKETIMKRIEKI